jgi:hypothetical protein
VKRYVYGLLVNRAKLKWVIIQNVVINTITDNLDDVKYKGVKGLQ